MWILVAALAKQTEAYIPAGIDYNTFDH